MKKDIKLNEMNLEAMDNVAGGYIHQALFRNSPWYYEVIDDKTGDTVKEFGLCKLQEAKAWAQAHGYSTEMISTKDLRLLRVKGPKIGNPPMA